MQGKQCWGVGSAQAGVHTEVVTENQSASRVVSIRPFCPALGASKHSHTPHERSPGFPQPFC